MVPHPDRTGISGSSFVFILPLGRYSYFHVKDICICSLLGSQEFNPWTDSLLGRLAIVALVLGQFSFHMKNPNIFFNFISGGIFLLVGTLGLVSTCCSSSSFSYSFSLLLLLLVIGQILACLLLLLLSSQLHMLIAQILKLTMPIYSPSSSSPLPSAVTTTWDLVQASIPCCGVKNPLLKFDATAFKCFHG